MVAIVTMIEQDGVIYENKPEYRCYRADYNSGCKVWFTRVGFHQQEKNGLLLPNSLVLTNVCLDRDEDDGIDKGMRLTQDTFDPEDFTITSIDSIPSTYNFIDVGHIDAYRWYKPTCYTRVDGSSTCATARALTPGLWYDFFYIIVNNLLMLLWVVYFIHQLKRFIRKVNIRHFGNDFNGIIIIHVVMNMLFKNHLNEL